VVTPSIGISVFPADGSTPAELIKNADTAMYHAKNSGRNNFQFFTSDLNAKVFESLMIESSLKAAIPDELYLEFQPQLSLSTQSALGCEALVRWRHPNMGLVGPDKFIPRAEASGLIKDIGRWVLEQSCQLIRDTGIRVAVNVSPLKLSQKDIVPMVSEAARGVDKGLLTLEITEGAFINDFENAKRKLEELKRNGISIALDDFGTGYSSLSYLRKLPIDYIKIDKSFIWDAHAKPIVVAIINLADNLGMATIAEGVENPEQMAFLERHGCNAVQGYYFSKPLGRDSLLAFMRAYSRGAGGPAKNRTAPEPLLTWSFTFSTGISAIDRQHKDLIAIINELHANTRNRDLARKSVDGLFAYARYHFDYEAGLMKRFGAPSAEDHLKDHDAFIEQISIFAETLETEPVAVSSKKISTFLARWLTNHILVVDRRLGKELFAAGYTE
jgi:hemerythrin-like metal-binding protein